MSAFRGERLMTINGERVTLRDLQIRFASIALANIANVLLAILILAGVALMFMGFAVSQRMFGMWLTVTAVALLFARLIFDFARGLAGPISRPPAGGTGVDGSPVSDGSRAAAVLFCLIVACVASPSILESTSNLLSKLSYEAFVHSPELSAYYEGRIDRGLDKLDRASADATSEVFSAIFTNNDQSRQSAGAAEWMWFFLVFSIVLSLIRALSSSYAAMCPPLQADGKPPLPGRARIMSYPKWLALCLYAAILVPATYFSLGALLKLGLDSGAAQSSSVQETLRAAGTAAMETSPPVSVNLDRVSARLQATAKPIQPPPPEGADKSKGAPKPSAPTQTPEQAQAQANARSDALEAVNNARTGVPTFELWRAAYEAAALRQAAKFKRYATAEQFDDQVASLAADYRKQILKMRSDLRSCLIGVSDLDNSIPSGIDPVIPPALANEVKKRCADAPNANKPLQEPRLPAPVSCDSECPAPSAPTASDCMNCQKAFHNYLYAWMADTPESAVLIVGLVGFGLFGAAIRMMGRPDKVTVTEFEIVAARQRADETRRVAQEATQKLQLAQAEATRTEKVFAAAKLRDELTELTQTTDQESTKYGDLQRQLSEAMQLAPIALLANDALAAYDDARKAALAAEVTERAATQLAQDADQTLKKLERAAVEDRSNFVIERPIPSPVAGGAAVEYVVSGAPAKVLVSGLGAAFTVFLAGKAGVQVFTEGGRTSSTGLLLACFVGAVFAEDIWRSASEALNSRLKPSKVSSPPPIAE